MEFFVENDNANRQINKINNLVQGGLSNVDIANHLAENQERNLRTGTLSWTPQEIAQIRQDFRLEDGSAVPHNLSGMVYCRACGKRIHSTAIACPACGARQRATRQGKSKVTAGVLALLLGGIGIHRFYLGQWWGLFYLLFFWTFIPAIIAFAEGIVFLLTDDEVWNQKYG